MPAMLRAAVRAFDVVAVALIFTAFS